MGSLSSLRSAFRNYTEISANERRIESRSELYTVRQLLESSTRMHMTVRDLCFRSFPDTFNRDIEMECDASQWMIGIQRNHILSDGIHNKTLYLTIISLRLQPHSNLQVFNVFDDCCFHGTFSNTFAGHVGDLASQLGGSFAVELDDTFVGHAISPGALDVIVADMADL